MPEKTKRNTLLILTALVVFVILIASALPQMELKPGQLLPSLSDTVVTPTPGVDIPSPSMATQTFLKAIIGFLFIIFLPMLIYGLVKKNPWRRILRSMTLATLITAIAITLLTFLASRYGSPPEQVPDLVTTTAVSPFTTAPIGSPPDWLVWIVFSVLAVLIGGMGLWVIHATTNRTVEQNRVAEEAEKAIDALKAGQDLKNVILRCYLQMSLALQQGQGIERQESMTTREFERLLEATGIPHEPVHDLTRLFESVRYGRRAVDTQDEQAAIASLNAIILYARDGRGPG